MEDFFIWITLHHIGNFSGWHVTQAKVSSHEEHGNFYNFLWKELQYILGLKLVEYLNTRDEELLFVSLEAIN